MHVEELSRLNRLRRFLSTPVADAISRADNEDELLKPHRREIAVFFCDLRSFTAFAAPSQPEDVHHVLDEYFDLLGESIRRSRSHRRGVHGRRADGVFQRPAAVRRSRVAGDDDGDGDSASDGERCSTVGGRGATTSGSASESRSASPTSA